eukprot:jgi/Chlat1/9106/Chrsp97S08419
MRGAAGPSPSSWGRSLSSSSAWWTPRGISLPARRPGYHGRVSVRCRVASGAAAGVGDNAPEAKAKSASRVPFKVAATAGVLALTGDAIGQGMTAYKKYQNLSPCCRKNFNAFAEMDLYRSFRMLSYGFLLYGPLSHFWYRWLDKLLPAPTFTNFVSKVALNQLLLGPVVLVIVFSWNLALVGRAKDIPDKLQHAWWPTLQKGWKFWIPASAINFAVVPLESRVLYMSSCAVVWNTILSLVSNA